MSVNTSCRYCVFATALDNYGQDDCKLDRLDKFQERGVKLGFENGSFVIEGRKCNTLRTQSWADQYQGKTKSELAQLVRKEVQLSCDIIIVASAPEVYPLNDIRLSINRAMHQTLLPKNIRVLLNIPNIPPTEVVKLFDSIPDGVSFHVDEVRLRGPDGQRLDRLKVLDMAADKCETSQCYAVFDAGFLIPHTFVEDLDRAVNDNLEVIALLKPKGNNGLVVNYKLHKLLCGNREILLEEYSDGALMGDDIIEKASWLFGKQGLNHMIKKVEDICKRM